MITDAIIGFLLSVATWLVGLMPTGDPIGLTTPSGIWAGYAQLNTVLPLSEVMTVLGLMVTLYAGIYAYLAIRRVKEWIPFLS